MANKKITLAICYDFDDTLSPGNMQEYDFIPKQLKMEKKTFWGEVKKDTKRNDMDQILAYLHHTLKTAEAKEVKFTKQAFKDYGKKIKFFPGVKDWFKRINSYGKSKSINIEHYIISSGIKPMIEGTEIAGEFKNIFACDFKYDAHGVARFPSVVINYTTKTQYLFRVNKGILNNWDNSVNRYTPDEQRPIPFSRIIYIGDGLTDVPAMKMTRLQGGYSIGVYKRGTKATCEQLLKHQRCSFIAPANYKENKHLDKIVKLLIDKIYFENNLH